MRLSRLFPLILMILLAVFLVGCGQAESPPAEEPGSQVTEPPAESSGAGVETGADSYAAEGIWEVIGPYSRDAVGADVVPLYLWGKSAPDHPVADGMASSWSAGFLSPEQKAVWDVFYYTYETTNWEAGKPHVGKNPSYQNVEFAASGWFDDWQVDSPEACQTAVQNGAGEIDWMRLQVSGLAALNKDFTVFETPSFVPDSCSLFWVIQDKSFYQYYIDASTGSFLGSKHI